jgi:hypothetical protein
MAHSKSHWGDEDPECHGDDSPESQEELFETAKHLGWTPADMQDSVFAAKYQDWLARQPK